MTKRGRSQSFFEWDKFYAKRNNYSYTARDAVF